MILLLGGTSETAELAQELADAGYRVLVSTASDQPLDVGRSERIERRSGRLDAAGLAALARQRGAKAIVDATHPYAEQAHQAACEAARQCGLPLFRLCRPPGQAAAKENVSVVDTHEQAAETACRQGRRIFLTVGATHLAVYARAAAATGAELFARVLDREESLEACRQAGLGPERVVAARGPFDLEQNRQHLRRFRADVLVTKDGGQAGGLPAKLQAAAAEACRVVLIRRPAPPDEPAAGFQSVQLLVAALRQAVVA